MDTPNPMFAKFDQVLGNPIPTNPNGVPSRADQVRAMETQQASAQNDTPASRAGQDIQEAGNNVESAMSEPANTTGQAVARGVKATDAAFSAIPKVASEYLPAPARQALTDIGTGIGKDVNTMADVVNKIPGFTDLVNAHPDTVSKLMSVLGTLVSGGNIATTILGADQGAKMTEGAVDTAKSVVSKAPGAISDATSSIKNSVVEPGQNELQQINEKITPKPTVKEARLAMDQGRLVKGKAPGIFTEGGADKVATPESQADSARTIQKNIPGAAQMDESTLHTALSEQIATKSKQLVPQMEATPLSEETFTKITDDMSNLKKTQMAEAKATDEPNIAKWQDNFEKIVTKNIKDGGNMNDIWNAAKEYDQSIKPNVKSATELSPEDLQTQKDVWLENRAILRDTLKDIGGKSFKEMHDMYEAQNGLMSKAKIETAGAPSKISKFKQAVTDHPVISGAAALGIDKVVKSTIGIGI